MKEICKLCPARGQCRPGLGRGWIKYKLMRCAACERS